MPSPHGVGRGRGPIAEAMGRVRCFAAFPHHPPSAPPPHPTFSAPKSGEGYVLRCMLALVVAVAAFPAAADTAVLQGLNKITARVSRFDAPVDQSVRFGSLVITVRACVKHPPEEPPESAAFLVIDELRNSGTQVESKRVFSGWMFASSPAVSALEDPIYDINVLDCKADATAAPSSSSSGK
jgi:hypothetical protein